MESDAKLSAVGTPYGTNDADANSAHANGAGNNSVHHMEQEYVQSVEHQEPSVLECSLHLSGMAEIVTMFQSLLGHQHYRFDSRSLAPMPYC